MKEAEHANKALVIEAFDMLFNRRDYTAAQHFWSPHYIQHSAHILRGRDGPIVFDRGEELARALSGSGPVAINGAGHRRSPTPNTLEAVTHFCANTPGVTS
jgi:hypothetical protein